MKNTWIQGGNDFTLREISTQLKNLPVAVYKIQEDQYENIFLTRMQDKFEFPYKVYGKDDVFVNRVIKTWDNTNSNLGVLLNGLRGTGKTVTAQQICNLINKPVFLLTRKHRNLVSFLNEVTEDVVLFIDEYEKMFDRNDSTLLTIMDGALKSTNRILFLLTTNNIHVEQNLLQRPSRIRYVKSYEDLPLETITEIVDDMLKNPTHKKDTIKMISHLPMITIDLVKAIVEEVNIHDESPELFKDYFNADNGDNDDFYNISTTNSSGEKTVFKYAAEISPDIAEIVEDDAVSNSIGNSFYINNNYMGDIQSIIDANTVVIGVRTVDQEVMEDSGKTQFKTVPTVFTLESTIKKHKAFQKFII